jgi:hypothetical protein
LLSNSSRVCDRAKLSTSGGRFTKQVAYAAGRTQEMRKAQRRDACTEGDYSHLASLTRSVIWALKLIDQIGYLHFRPPRDRQRKSIFALSARVPMSTRSLELSMKETVRASKCNFNTHDYSPRSRGQRSSDSSLVFDPHLSTLSLNI